MAGMVTCPNGHTFRTQAHGKGTRCKQCGAAVYVPVAIRSGPPRPRRTGNLIGRPRIPRADKAPRSVTTARTVPNTDALGGLLTFATNYAAARAAAKSAPKLAPKPAPTSVAGTRTGRSASVGLRCVRVE
jgi:hypothetical protein